MAALFESGSSSTVVIKVKYGDMLRRFNAQIVEDKLLLNMDGLKNKIVSLFSFAPDTELMLTYIDEDSDVVALVDDDDLRDVVKQGLNPVRITLKVNDEKNGSQYNHSNASSTPLRSPRMPQPLPNLNAGISEILRKVPEPLRETLIKFSDDLASKASSSAPGISELVDYYSKLSLSYLGQLSESQVGVSSNTCGGVHESSTAAQESKESGLSKSDSALAPALDSQKINVAKPGDESLQNLAPVDPESGVVSDTVGKKEKVKKMVECSNEKSHLTSDLPAAANNVGKAADSHIASCNFPSGVDNVFAGKEVCNSSEAKLDSNSGSVAAADPKNGERANDRARSVGKSPTPIWAPHPGGFNFGSFSGPSITYECPFSGTVLENISGAPQQSASDAVLSRRNINQNDGIGNIFHRGVRCDGCGVHPITGPRFKSKVKVDYDLCCICFEEMGNENDYIRMDRPAVYRHHMPFKGLHNARARDQGPMFPHVYKGCKVKLGAAKLDSRFIKDVNVFDGTVMAPSTPFTKIWRMRNNGTVMWPQNTQLVWIGGDKLTDALSVELEIPAAGLIIDQELDVAVDFVSPALPGRYISYWRMASPSGQKFGQRVWVLIQVDANIKETPRANVRNLNLNLPPVSSCLTGPEIISVDPEPLVENSHPEVDKSKKMAEMGKPNTDQELKFPINDSLLVGNGASSSVPPSAPPAVSYPIIDLSDVAPSLPSVSPAMLYPSPPPPPPGATVASALESAVELPGKNQVEEQLLRELEEMGFKQVDLNKEVLRMNEYDIEQAVDDLCGVAEWDPILEELQEMGFHDTEMNKMLLKKNNGSIKRVVMDLIAGEKI